MQSKLLVIALGGNAILQRGDKGTADEQFYNINETARKLSQLIKNGERIVITHGNGPQVGNLLIQHEAARSEVPPLPLDVCVAQSQGQIGYMLQKAMGNQLHVLGLDNPVVTLVTQAEVSQNDPAFNKPVKPVGPFLNEREACKLAETGIAVIEQAGKGWRRVVPSPQPIKIVERDAIRQLVDNQVVVIVAGGGGIPVYTLDGGQEYKGIEAVIDKDRAGEVLAEDVKADMFVILTDVKQVALNYNTPKQTDLVRMTTTDVRQYLDEGHFAPGSMGPKVEAVLKFVETTGKEAAIGHPFAVIDVISGKSGTRVVKGDEKML